jgi:hypothetical protein
MKGSFEVIGYINKEEEVSGLSHSILKNTFVIDISHPFPGYSREKISTLTTPRGVLFLTNNKYDWDKILRTTRKINSFLDYDINGSYASINLWNGDYHALRIKGIPSYEEIPIIQHAFQEEGYVFMKKRSMKGDMTAQIKVKKFFSLQEVGEGIYMDGDSNDMSYIKINQLLNWELFRKITMKIKNNISNRNYDVVNGAFYKDHSVVEMIRIYKPDMSKKLLEEIRDNYNKEIAKYF